MTYRQRQPEEVLREIERSSSWDTAGLYRSILLITLPYESAKPWLKPGVTQDQWVDDQEALHKLDEYFRGPILAAWAQDIIKAQPVGCFVAVMQCLATKYLLSHDDWHRMPGINGDLTETGMYGAKLFKLVSQQVESGEWVYLTETGGFYGKPASA